MARTINFFKRHQQALLRIGGLMMMAVGVLLLSGLWNQLIGVLRQRTAQFGTPL